MDGREGYARHVEPALHDRLRACGLDVEYVRARGDFLYRLGDDGAEIEILDLAGGFGAALLGHNHPRIVARARELLESERPFHAQGSVRAAAGRLAARLSGILSGAGGAEVVVTLANSGAEAVEAALKHAALERRRRLEAEADATRRAAEGGGESLVARGEELARAALELAEMPPLYLGLERAFHGKTTGALQLTHHLEYREPWRALGVRARAIRPEDLAALERALADETVSLRVLEPDGDGGAREAERRFVDVAALFVEPIQGEGGVQVISTGYLQALRAAADAGGFPLVLDEIQSGMGRAGTFLAAEQAGVAGDYVLLAKALGGGLAKIAALLIRRDRYLPDFGSRHSSTYAKDDHASELALVALDLIERDGLVARCRETGDHLLARLRELADRYPDQIADVRGRGLMVGIELAGQRESRSPLLRVLAEQESLGLVLAGHLLHEHRIRIFPTISARTTLRVEPSAYIERASIDRFLSALEAVCVLLRRADAHALVRFLTDPEPVTSLRSGGAAGELPRAVILQRREPAPISGARVAFLAHFLAPGDLRGWDPSLGPLDDEACERFLHRTRGGLDPFVVGRQVFRSPRGSACEVVVIGLAFTPAGVMESFRRGEGEWSLELVAGGVDLARELGCRIVGFGGYSSIITDNCRDVRAPGLALTSGNSLTAAAAVEALFGEADRRGVARRRLGILGAAGNIGAVLAEVCADRADEMVLVGRPRALGRLEAARARLAGLGAARIDVATDLAALAGCDLVLSATNAPRPVILPEHVGEGPVILCDIAVPGDVDATVLVERPAAVLLKGGVVRAPMGQEISIDGLDLAPGELYGCLAETVLLGLSGTFEDFSRGSLRADRVRRIRELALEHGFSLSVG